MGNVWCEVVDSMLLLLTFIKDIEFHIKRMLLFISGVGHLVNWVFRIFQSFSRYSNLRAHKSRRVMPFLQYAISPIKNNAGALRRQLLTEHSRHFLIILLWIYHKYKLWVWPSDIFVHMNYYHLCEKEKLLLCCSKIFKFGCCTERNSDVSFCIWLKVSRIWYLMPRYPRVPYSRRGWGSTQAKYQDLRLLRESRQLIMSSKTVCFHHRRSCTRNILLFRHVYT